MSRQELWRLVMLWWFVFLAGVVAFAVVARATQRFSPGVLAAVGCAVAVAVLFPMLASKAFKASVAPRAAYIVGFGAVIMVAALGWGMINTLRHPQLVTYPEEICAELRAAHKEAGSENGPTCRFSAYLFPAKGAGYYAYGFSENVAGKCMYMDASLVVPSTLAPDYDAPAITALPEKCADELKMEIDVFPPLRW